jgi:apolipoprotein N-acyltransferase
MITVLAALLSAGMFYLSQGLDNVWALAWLAPAPLLWLAYGKTPLWQLLAASAAASIAGSIYVFQAYSMLPPLVVLPAVGLSTALFCIAVWFARFAHRHAAPLVTLFAFPACWTAIEFLAEFASPNGTYGSLAYSTMSAPLLIQSASLLGMYAVTFLICLFANTLAMSLRASRDALPALATGFGLCAANVVFGFARLEQPQHDTVRVAAMVDETAMAAVGRARTLSDAVAIADAYAAALRRAVAQGARFAVTPEGGMLSVPGWRTAVIAPLLAVAKPAGMEVIAGFYQRQPPADFALAIRSDGTMQSYDKRHLVPVLEDRFTPGHASGWLGHGRAVEICKDMDFPRTIRADAAKGVRLMGVPAGDFGRDAWLHARMAIMRGVENGFALVRAANQGLVTASDAQGRLIASKLDTPTGLTMIVATLPLGPGPTLYTRIGNAFPWLCVAASLAIGVIALLGRRKTRR